MSNGVSAGIITLDLVIKNQISKQLEKIKSDISKPIESISKQAGAAAEKSVQKVKVTLKTVSENCKFASKELDDMIKKAAQVKPIDTSKTSAPKSVKLSGASGSALDELKKQGIADPITESIQQAQKKAEEFKKKLSEIGTFKISADPVERLEQQLENTNEKISIVQKRWQELSTALGEAKTDEEAAKITNQLNATEKQLISLQSSAEKLDGKLNKPIEETPEKVLKIGTSFNKVSSVASSALGKIKSGFSSSFSKLKTIAGKSVSAIASKFKSLKTSVNSVNNPVSKLGKSFGRAAKSVFLMAGAYAAFRAIKNAVSEACKSNDEFSNSLNEIKANLTIAFQPVMQAIMPAINSLVSGLARVTKYLATFTSELFGSTYKKSLDTVKKIKEVGKEAQKNSTYLAGFDEMNVAQDASEDSSSESSSDESGIDWSKISGEGAELPDWAEKLKAAIKSGDWEGVGKILAQRINSVIASIKWKKLQDKINKGAKSLAKGLNGFAKGINWNKLGKAVGEGFNTIFGAGYSFMSTFDWESLGTGFTESVNGAVKTADWSLIGKTFAAKWNAIIDTAYAFVTNFDFKGFGTSVGTSVNAWFEEIDFAKAGKTLGETIKGILDTGISFLQTVDWQEVGEKVWAFIKSVDWGGIVSRLFELIGSLIGASVSLLWGFIKDAVYSIRDYFKEQIEDCGGNIVEGLFMGIGGALVNLGTWIKEHVFDPFINGFKKCFGIHSPSKVMDEQGGFIMQGLLNGITSRVAEVINKFKEVLRKIKKVFTSIPSWFKTKFSDALDKVKEAFSLKSIKEHFTSIKDKIVEIFGGLKDALKEPLNWVIDLINKCIGGLNSLSIDILDWVPEFGGSTFGFNIPEIPRLATGGLATAPTLAMVGDNRNAATDPEAILPVSKLQEMLDTGRLEEVAQLLREILALLQGLNFNLTATVDRRVLFQIIREMNEQYKRRTGVSAFE